MIRLALSGAAGRMGHAVIAACREAADFTLVAALEHDGCAHLDADPGELAGGPALGVAVTAALPAAARPQLLVDFSVPAAAVTWARHCAEAGLPMVSGTTGLDAGQQDEVRAAARRSPMVFAPNMSIGVNLCFALTALAAGTLGARADVEIVEAHHAAKRDAPSGTALRLGEEVRRARGDAADVAVYGRGGDGVRAPGSIGYASLRAGDVIGDHTVLFGMAGERVEITHRAGHRGLFATGALLAARWVQQQPPGLYDMQDVLGLRRARD